MSNFLRNIAKTFFVLYSVGFQCFTRKMKEYMKKNEYIVCYIQKIAYLCNVIKRETDSPIWLHCSLTY